MAAQNISWSVSSSLRLGTVLPAACVCPGGGG
eukprot:COSAG01_NODE_54304_length_333_cov_0.576923_1_plen_31_part_10